VGGLPPEAQDEDLRQHFKQYGELLESQVICDKATGRSRNFGFITLHEDSRKEAALRDNHNVCGKRVSVRLHQDMEPLGNSYGRKEEISQESELRKVFIGRLEPHFTSELLQSRFTERFGKVSDVFLANGKKFGFVTFDTIHTARDALDAGTLDVDGISIVIKAASPMKSGGSGKDGRERDGSPPPEGGSTSAYPYGYGYAAYGAYGYGAPPSSYGYPPPSYYDSHAPPVGYGYGSYGYPPPSSAYGSYPGYPGYGYGSYYPPPSGGAPPGGGYGPLPPSSGSGSRSRPY
jgi:RNA-binding protein Musashi